MFQKNKTEILFMQIHLVSGFLGSGKTTAIRTACGVMMEEGKKVGVITNDQGIKLVDTGYFESALIPNRQVVNGCFCCNYDALDSNIQSLVEANETDVIFAESVGSCTDIVATVMKPLRQYRNDAEVTVSTFADALLLKMLYVDGKELFGEEVNYIYQKQLEEAGIIVVSKMDLISIEAFRHVQDFLQKHYPLKTIVYVNGREADSVLQWLAALEKHNKKRSRLSSLQIDYDTYGAGEAMLAWLDEELELHSEQEQAEEDALALADKIYQTIREKRLAIGHLKFLVNGTHKISYTATGKEKLPVAVNPSSSCRLLMNARIETLPEKLEKLIDNVIRETEANRQCKIVVNSLSAFQPGYPTPTHRMAD